MLEADIFRVATLVGAVFTMAFFPMAAWMQGRHWTAWLAIASYELLTLSLMFEISMHFGEHFVWYRTPLLLISEALMGAFIVSVFTGQHKRGT